VAGGPATVNTGGGGGGGGDATSTGGAGGSGIVIISYPNTSRDIVSFTAGLTVNGISTTGSNAVTPDTTSLAGYKIYKFTAGTGTIQF
jgi:hypothetical protein